MAQTGPREVAFAQARQELAGLDVDFDGFAAWVEERLDPGDTLDEVIEGLHITDLLMVYGCLRGNRLALEAFERLVNTVARTAIVKAQADEVDEALQRFRTQMLVGSSPGKQPKLATYRGTGPLAGWMRICASRDVLMERRRARPQTASPDGAMADVLAIDPELEMIKSSASDAFRRAFLESLAELSDRDRAIVRYTAIEGLRGDEVAKIYRVHPSSVSRWLANARAQLLDGTRERLVRELGIPGTDFATVMDLIASRLDMSLGGALGRREAAKSGIDAAKSGIDAEEPEP